MLGLNQIFVRETSIKRYKSLPISNIITKLSSLISYVYVIYVKNM